jgi:hypothetical protein
MRIRITDLASVDSFCGSSEGSNEDTCYDAKPIQFCSKSGNSQWRTCCIISCTSSRTTSLHTATLSLKFLVRTRP